LEVLRAIRDQHPNVGVGTSWVDPYTVAFEAGLGYPDGPFYGRAIEYLVEEDARRSGRVTLQEIISDLEGAA
jgi:hypothetical protein